MKKAKEDKLSLGYRCTKDKGTQHDNRERNHHEASKEGENDAHGFTRKEFISQSEDES